MNSNPTDQRPATERTGGTPAGVRPPPLPPARPPGAARQVDVRAGPALPADIGRALSAAAPHARRVGKFLVYIFVPLALLALIAGGVIAMRLRHGPISFDILVPPIERGINAELDGNTVKIKSAELRVGNGGGLEFRLVDMSLSDETGAIVAAAPLSAVNISTSALWRARIVPEKVVLIDPEINLAFSEETGLSMSLSKLSGSGKAGSEKAGSEKAAGAAGKDAPQLPAAGPETSGSAISKDKPIAKPLNLAKLLSESSARARRKMDATSYLSEFGIQNATVVLDYAGRRSSWRITDASIDFSHKRKRSVISGRATVASERGPWAFSFLTDETDKAGRLVVKTAIRDLVPSTLAAAAPPLALLKMFDVPVAGDASVELAIEGDVEKAEIALEVGTGRLVLPGVSADPLRLTAGLFRLNYDGAERQWQLLPSPVKWADGNIQFSGTAKDISGEKGPPVWRYSIDGKNGTLEANEFKVAPVSLEQWSVLGSIIPRRGVVEIGDFRMKGGGGEISFKAMTQAGPQGQSSRADVTFTPMPLDTLKAMWPRALAPGARAWVGERVTSASFKGGTVHFASGEFMHGEAPVLGDIGERLSATFEVADATMLALKGMAPIVAPRTLVRLENNALEVAIPEAHAVLQGNRKVPIKGGRLTSPDVMGPRPDSELVFSVQSALGPFLEVLETLPVRPVREASPLPKAADGKVDAQFKIKLPLVSGLDAEEVSIEGKAKITDGRFGKVGGQFDVQGFTLALDLTGAALEAKGDLLVNGVPAKITGQRIFSASTDQQPPVKVTASLDDTDRNQLGLDINDIVQGVVPIEVTLAKGATSEPVIHLKADLTNAELNIEPIAWRKAQGRPAVLDTDIASGKSHKTELQNFKVAGDDVAIEGWVGVGADNKMKEFFFPDFSLNVVSRLEVQGTRGGDSVWNIKAHGKNFDGRDFFKSLFSVGEEQKAKSLKPNPGIDLSAEIDNVIGHSDVSLRGLKLKLSSRAEKLTKLDARGTLDGGAPLAAVLDAKPGTPRRLLADSTDAGATMKLLDFYPNVQGGRLQLEVNLDGKGNAEKTGILWVNNFKVLGDPIVSEVVGSADQGRPAISGKKQVTREVFNFDQLKAPFSIGYGQFVLEESYVKGPVMGANMRGKADFKTRRINIGGTYIPLQGLNGALGGIPLLGQILSGAHGEGIFGITFAVQGAMSEPQVLVNPLSIVTPGILRGLMEMTPYDPKIQTRDEIAPSKPVEQRVRASAPPVEVSQPPARKTRPAAATPGISDGWTSTTTP